MLQSDRSLKLIAKSIETKIKKELENMLSKDRENYKKFFKIFGNQLKYGVYNNYGMDKDKLKDLLLFYSADKKDYITLKEYEIKEKQDKIYYACGDTVEKIDLLPQVEMVKDKGYDILYLTDYVDEFTIKALMNYDEKPFINVASKDLDLDTLEEQEELTKINC